MASGDHFGWPKINFDRISRNFRSIRNFFLKWPLATILDAQFLPKSIRTSLYSRSVATSILIKLWSAQTFSSYFHTMASGGHFCFPIEFFHSRSSMAASNINLIHVLVSQVTWNTSLGLRRRRLASDKTENWCICLRANTGYVPEWITRWKLWCPGIMSDWRNFQNSNIKLND